MMQQQQQQQPQQQPTTAKTARRKVSVFSHDGFPSIHQLDQTNLRQRSDPANHQAGAASVANATSGPQAIAANTTSTCTSTNTISSSSPLQATSAALLPSGSASSSSLAPSRSSASPPQPPVSVVVAAAAEAADKARRSARSDTLGSTGSSRASSCDEPTIISDTCQAGPRPAASTVAPLGPTVAAGQAKQQVPAAAATITNTHNNHSNSEQAPVNAMSLADAKSAQTSFSSGCVATKRKSSLGTNATTSSTCSSYSSLESIGGTQTNAPCGSSSLVASLSQTSSCAPTWPLDTMLSAKQQAVDSARTSNTSAAGAITTTTTMNTAATGHGKLLASQAGSSAVPPPFESIRSQLGDGNSPPTAQLIQRHIEKLISQNEAIVDNWNLVSIRSYNSASSRNELTAGSGNNNQEQQQPSSSSIPLKRSSVACASGVASSSRSGDLGLGAQQQQHQQQLTSRSSTSRQGSSRPIATKQRWSTTALGNPGLLIRSQHNHHPSALVQRLPTIVTSSGQSSSGDIPAETLTASHHHHHHHQQQQQRDDLTLGVQLAPQIIGAYGSASVPNSPRSNVSVAAVNRELELKRLQQLSSFGAPTTGNWPLEPSSWTGLLTTSDHSLNLESAIENLSLKRRSQVDQPQLLISTTSAAPTSTTLSSGTADSSALAGHQNPNLTATMVPSQSRLTAAISAQQQQASENDHLIRQQRDELLLKLAILQQEQRQQQQANTGHQQLAAAYLQHLQQQQQFVEQQLDQLRISQQIEHQQRVARALAAVVASASSASAPATATATPATASSTTTTTTTPATTTEPINHQQYLQEHQALEAQLLNDFLAKMILGQQQQQQQQGQMPPVGSQIPEREHHGDHRDKKQFSSSQTSIDGINQANFHQLGHGTELLTQSLDSATPAHRCEPCDISFWTRDLLNYHQMTQCRARTGPAPARPIAFNFSGPNGFDSMINSEQQSSAGSNMESNCISNEQQQQHLQFLAAKPIQHRHIHNLNNHFQFTSSGNSSCSSSSSTNTIEAQQASKSVSPPRRRTTTTTATIDTNDNPLFHQHFETGSINPYIRVGQQLAPSSQLFYVGSSSSGSCSGSGGNVGSISNASASMNSHWCQSTLATTSRQVMDELSILKQQLLAAETSTPSMTSIESSAPMAPLTIATNTSASSTITLATGIQQHGHGTLPFKKRKISEPNMRY